MVILATLGDYFLYEDQSKYTKLLQTFVKFSIFQHRFCRETSHSCKGVLYASQLSNFIPYGRAQNQPQRNRLSKRNAMLVPHLGHLGTPVSSFCSDTENQPCQSLQGNVLMSA